MSPKQFPLKDLTKMSCKSSKEGVVALTSARIREGLKQIPGWKFTAGEIVKIYEFKNYFQTMAFVNATAWISHQENHHPDLEVGYNKCKVRFSTHDVGGISENDLICAAKVEALGKV
jgi:4a-hydroxytetrahydrobiopterin dehydratase